LRKIISSLLDEDAGGQGQPVATLNFDLSIPQKRYILFSATTPPQNQYTKLAQWSADGSAGPWRLAPRLIFRARRASTFPLQTASCSCGRRILMVQTKTAPWSKHHNGPTRRRLSLSASFDLVRYTSSNPRWLPAKQVSALLDQPGSDFDVSGPVFRPSWPPGARLCLTKAAALARPPPFDIADCWQQASCSRGVSECLEKKNASATTGLEVTGHSRLRGGATHAPLASRPLTSDPPPPHNRNVRGPAVPNRLPPPVAPPRAISIKKKLKKLNKIGSPSNISGRTAEAESKFPTTWRAPRPSPSGPPAAVCVLNPTPLQSNNRWRVGCWSVRGQMLTIC